MHLIAGRWLSICKLANPLVVLQTSLCVIGCLHLCNMFIRLRNLPPRCFFFEAIIALNASVMLVLTTMFINVSNNLPKTAYIKMIDIWLLFNLFKPFVDIIMQTYIENLKTEEGEKRDVNHHGKVVQVGQAIELR